MGSDDLFHKRKARSLNKLQRKKSNRSPYAKVLIVCEGEKTEPQYFSDARNYYKLNTVNVEIRGDMGSDPLSLVKFAKQRYREEKDAGDSYDNVFCVFDRDEHSHYAQALHDLNHILPQKTFVAINSVPCFEYWLLLHFSYSTSPFSASSGRTAAQNSVKDLKSFMPNYQKGDRVFNELVGQLEFAKVNAKRVYEENTRTGNENPSTRVHELIEFLQNVKI